MSSSVTVVIKSTGTIRFLVGEDTEPFINNAMIRRASYVEPVNTLLRCVFHTLRRLFGDYGKIAKFTRIWPCLWQINLAPIGQGILPDTYRNRQKAIEREIEFLYTNFI